MFKYTQEEMDYFEGLLWNIYTSGINQPVDAEHLRYHAELLLTGPCTPTHEGMHPDDMDEPSASNFLEIEDQLECGFAPGESL